MSPVSLTIAELSAARQLDLGHSRWVTVSQKRIDTFADATEDHQWIHTDEARAREANTTTIAHGMLTLSLIPALMADLLLVPDATARLNYGIDRVRFLTPVPAGSEARLHARIADVAEHRLGVLYRTDAEVELRGVERPAVVARLVSIATPAGPRGKEDA